jgi:hypothetical protein
MPTLHDRVRRVTDDLKKIQGELSAAAESGADPARREQIMQELVAGDLVAEFKTSVDNMRHLLWSYIEASSQHDAQRITQTLRAVRMQRVTEMLKILQPTVNEEEMLNSPESDSFFDVINKIAHRTLEQHQKSTE